MLLLFKIDKIGSESAYVVETTVFSTKGHLKWTMCQTVILCYYNKYENYVRNHYKKLL